MRLERDHCRKCMHSQGFPNFESVGLAFGGWGREEQWWEDICVYILTGSQVLVVVLELPTPFCKQSDGHVCVCD